MAFRAFDCLAGEDQSLDQALSFVSEIRQLLTLQGGGSARPTKVSLYSQYRSAGHIPARDVAEVWQEPLDLVRPIIHPWTRLSSEAPEFLLSAPQHPSA